MGLAGILRLSRLANATASVMHRWLVEFGLTPSAASRVRIASEPVKADEAAKDRLFQKRALTMETAEANRLLQGR